MENWLKAFCMAFYILGTLITFITGAGGTLMAIDSTATLNKAVIWTVLGYSLLVVVCKLCYDANEGPEDME